MILSYVHQMRILSVTVDGVGGLVDQTIALPETPVVAFAGPNGTGKTKLLGAMVSPWSRQLPNARHDSASAEIDVALSDSERAAIKAFDDAHSWGGPEIPEKVTLGFRHDKYQGHMFVVRADQNSDAPPLMQLPAALYEFPHNQTFLLEHPSLNLMYLPAERRLMPAGAGAIDMQVLAEEVAYQRSAESRQAVVNYGRLDDSEFEQFAKALCMADKLDSEPGEEANVVPLSRISWEQFRDTVNALIYPKVLLPLTRQHPDALRIRLPGGEVHPIPDLSSGERQALIIISRVLRAGAGNTTVLIDEPDAYLHPNLSQRLIDILIDGVGSDGQLLIATHSPAILDRIPPSSIIRLDHENDARPVSTNTGLIELHRETGFKASSITQSDLLVVTEGELDEVVLKNLYPQLTRASVSQGQGRAGVIAKVEHLASYGVPVIGLVDHDVTPPSIDPTLQEMIVVLPTADIEGAFLFDDAALQLMLDHRLTTASYRTLKSLQDARDELVDQIRETTIAELMQSTLRSRSVITWPRPRGDDAIERLRRAVDAFAPPDDAAVDSAHTTAVQQWDANVSDLSGIVRGKYILGEFASRTSQFKKGAALLETLSTHRPELTALKAFADKLASLLTLY